jgi:tyrosyl-tRNA synthetase
MERYYLLLLSEELPQIHPMDAKKQLAFRVVERYHSREAAQAALDEFNTRFSKKDLAQADLPEVSLDAEAASNIVSAVVAAYAQAFNLTKSRGDARRLVEQGSVQWEGEKVTDPKATPNFAAGGILKLDKTRAVRVGA